MKARDNTVWGNEGEMPARGQSLLAGDGEPQATRLRGGLIESAPQSGEERGREHYGRKEERPRVRNEEKTYDYKGLLISRWRGVAWGSGVETGGTRGVPGFALQRRTPALAMWERPGGSLVLHDAMYRAGTGPGLQFRSGRPCPCPCASACACSCATQLFGHARHALLYSSRWSPFPSLSPSAKLPR